ncbi:phosphate ABC transporter permease subunit PstC [Lignipirellula cremea]|uniref:Phosphate transport system permease protein n=1 Tax=Lignipirellula cremea TaxID=2528010 RepID=A0A518E297_9BACT|nr:phosphate ABC transporter permease subunit PstC [Lignipirellula cremea]QDU98211.1 Phosphate transport system permease protein PstC [Lignipirellula cremea]
MSQVAKPIVGDESSEAVKRFRIEFSVQSLLACCAAISVFTTIGIVVVLVHGSVKFFELVSIWDFLTDTRWAPLSKKDPHFGVLPLACGTMLVAVGAALFAVPIGLATAVYLSEYAPRGLRNVVKPLLEILAGIPSVVYGFLAVMFVSPWIQSMAPQEGPFKASPSNALSAAIVVGIMILPMVVSLSEDVLRSVPRSLRDAAFALGSTKFEVIVRVLLPAALSGIVAAVLLAICRAIGETMAVALAAGNTPNLTLNPLERVQTMTAYIVQVSIGDSPVGSPQYYTIFAVAATLFVITMTMNVIAQWILSRMRERYE